MLPKKFSFITVNSYHDNHYENVSLWTHAVGCDLRAANSPAAGRDLLNGRAGETGESSTKGSCPVLLLRSHQEPRLCGADAAVYH